MSVLSPLQLVVVGRDPLALGGIASLFGGRDGLLVLAQLGPEELTGDARSLDADLVVFDAAGFSEGGFLPRVPDLPTLALAVHADDARLLRDAGAAGVLRRDGNPERLVRAAHAVANGLVVVDEDFAEGLFRPRRPQVEGEVFSGREVEVLELLAEGFSNKEIGAELGISPHTAKFHVQGILDKMDALTRTEAVVRALRLGFLQL